MVIDQTINPTGNGTYQQCYSAYTHWVALSDDSNTTDIYIDNIMTKIDTYVMSNPTRIGSIKNVRPVAYAGHASGVGSAYASTVIYNGSSQQIGSEVYMGTSLSYHTVTTDYPLNPWTGNPWTWAEVDAIQSGVRLRMGSSGGYCVCRKAWLVVTSGSSNILSYRRRKI